MGLPSLRAAFPTMPRCELRELQQAYRREFQATHRRITEDLTWHWPGRVWAMDHAKPPQPIDNVYPAIFSIRDLASGMQLAWRPVIDETAETTLAVLKSLIEEHGPRWSSRATTVRPSKARRSANSWRPTTSSGCLHPRSHHGTMARVRRPTAA
jgi:hypothetical protein